MKDRFRLIQRGLRGGTFYCVDSQTGKRQSLSTKDAAEAAQLVLAKNQAVQQPALNLQMAKAFLAASDDELGKRSWQDAIDALVDTKHNSTKARFKSKEEAEGMKKNIEQRVPRGRFGRAEEMASAILFLVSNDSSFSNGIDLVADGGMTQG
jgi:hypothetical protein